MMKKLWLAPLGLALLFCVGARADEQQVPDETRVVYPASATSKEPMVVRVKRRVAPPVQEDEDYDVDTPIGQVARVLDRLDEIKDALEEYAEAQENGAFSDEDRAALDEIARALKEQSERAPANDPRLWWALLALAVLIVWTKRRECAPSCAARSTP